MNESELVSRVPGPADSVGVAAVTLRVMVSVSYGCVLSESLSTLHMFPFHLCESCDLIIIIRVL